MKIPRLLSGFFAAFFLFISLAGARQVEITVIHTTDLHGHILPTKDYSGRENLGGFLRCATRISEIRSEKANTVLLDVGDTYQGSPESYLTRGRLIIDALNYFNYDAWVLGNHEIDWGPESLRKLHDLAEVPFLAANLHFLDAADNWLPKIAPYVIKNVDGVRVAIIGLTTPGIPRWSRPHLLDGALFKRSVDTLAGIMPAVRNEDPDVIIVAAHQGYRERGDDFANEIQAIAANFPEIDLLLGGHTHKPVEDMRIGNVLYSQAGYHGIWLGRAELVFDTVEDKVVSKKGRLELMDSSVLPHPDLEARWKKELDEAAVELDMVVGVLEDRVDPKPDAFGVSTMQQLICNAIASAVDVDFVIHGSLGDEPMEPGAVRYRDIWEIVPYENTIGILQLTPEEMAKVLAENHSRQITSQSLGPWGFSCTLSDNGDGSTVRSPTALRANDGSALHSRKRYRVAFNSYTLASGGERYLALRGLADQPESRLLMTPHDTRSLVVQYLKQKIPPKSSVADDTREETNGEP